MTSKRKIQEDVIDQITIQSSSKSISKSKKRKVDPIIVHQFWQDLTHPIEAEIKLDPVRILSIKSYLTQGYQVYFWSYQKITNLPADQHLIIKKASEIVPKKTYQSYHCHSSRKSVSPKRINIANFSDLLRLKAIFKYGGWWADSDTFCLNKLPIPDQKDQGFICATTHVKKTGAYKRLDFIFLGAEKVRSSNQGIWKDWDGWAQFSNCIMYAEKGHSLIKKLIQVTKKCLDEEICYFTHPMYILHRTILEDGYIGSVRPPNVFIPYPWWKTKYCRTGSLSNRKVYGCLLPTTKQVLRNSSTIHFFNGLFEILCQVDDPETPLVQIFNHICCQSGVEMNHTSLREGDDNNYNLIK